MTMCIFCCCFFFLQDTTPTCEEEEQVTTNNQSKRLLSLDTFRGYVMAILFIGPVRPVYGDPFQSRLRHDEDLQFQCNE